MQLLPQTEEETESNPLSTEEEEKSTGIGQSLFSNGTIESPKQVINQQHYFGQS